MGDCGWGDGDSEGETGYVLVTVTTSVPFVSGIKGVDVVIGVVVVSFILIDGVEVSIEVFILIDEVGVNVVVEIMELESVAFGLTDVVGMELELDEFEVADEVEIGTREVVDVTMDELATLVCVATIGEMRIPTRTRAVNGIESCMVLPAQNGQ